MSEKRVILVAACALIDPDGRVLIAQRPEGKTMAGLWEFPGGKVEAGESPEQTVIREMREELGVTIDEACLSPFMFVSHAYEDFHLLMPLFLCRRWDGTVTPQEDQKTAWVKPKDLEPKNFEKGDNPYPMPAADIPLIPHLRDFL